MQGTGSRTESVLAELFERCPVAIGIRDVRGQEIIHVEDNPPAAALFRKTPDELRGRSESELGISRAQIDRAIARFRAARASSKAVSVEMSVNLPDGPHLLAGTVLAVDHPDAERYAFLIDDVTELRALQASAVRAQQLSTLGTLSASIGHEIANPAMYAQMHLQFALESAINDGASKATLDDMRTALTGLGQVTSLLRDLRSLSMDSTPASEVTDLGSALETVLELVRPALESTVLHVNNPAVPAVTGSRGRLVQVLLNLVRNAIESVADRHGNIWIDVVERTPESVQIEVADDGPGLSSELRARLFEPFVTTKQNGTGLGLYVSRMLITRAKGTIEALDREGGGLRMRIVLPTAG